ncbi:hypothetical protein SAMN02745912_03549 [Paramaledivibacter caminithermalis DSM 15212]|nr:hypothetical protein SAMN02745912_03548 [Paramaledivibacter caminithermalis DSM 15212]SHK51588.1 hypothetical protein SAMN02745912_03549 [Paramaledivibacter caminithermalis DSM 15212]
MKKLESLYEQSIKLEKDNKLDKADKKWDEFYKILDKYFDENAIMINLEDLSF